MPVNFNPKPDDAPQRPPPPPNPPPVAGSAESDRQPVSIGIAAIAAAALLREVQRREKRGGPNSGAERSKSNPVNKALTAMATDMDPRVRLRPDGTAFLQGDDLGVTF
jgi:hypothetical protein